MSAEVTVFQSNCGSSPSSVTSAIGATMFTSSIASPMARVLFGRGVCGGSPIVAFPSGGPGNLGVVGLTSVVARGISTADENVATGVDGGGMLASDASWVWRRWIVRSRLIRKALVLRSWR